MAASRGPCAGNLAVRADILRGVRTSRALHAGAKVWFCPPQGLPLAAREKLWRQSEECSALDAFISHPWNAPGWQKYITLLVFFYWRPAVYMGLVSLLALLCLDAAGYMPTLEVVGDLSFVSRWSPWGFLPVTVALLFLILAPSLPGSLPGLREQKVFIDALCINQLDDELKNEGIGALAGIVANSSELIILWHPSYFSRAWCVLELAVFAAMDGNRAIHVRPLFLSTTMLVGYSLSFVVLGVYTLAEYVNSKCDQALLPSLLRVLVFLPIPVFAHRLRLQFLATQELTLQLEQFSFDTAQCSLTRDLEFIRETVVALHGSLDGFNEYVRRHLRNQLKASEHDFEFRYAHFQMILAPACLNTFPYVIALAREGLTTPRFLSGVTMTITNSLVFGPCTVKLLFVLCRRLARQRENAWVNAGISAGIAILFFLPIGGVAAMHSFLFDQFDYGGVVSVCIGSLVTFLAFGTEVRRRGRDRTSEQDIAPQRATQESVTEDALPAGPTQTASAEVCDRHACKTSFTLFEL